MIIRAWGAAREAVLAGVPWQRCHYHLAQNAINYAQELKISKCIGEKLRRIWNAPYRPGGRPGRTQASFGEKCRATA